MDFGPAFSGGRIPNLASSSEPPFLSVSTIAHPRRVYEGSTKEGPTNPRTTAPQTPATTNPRTTAPQTPATTNPRRQHPRPRRPQIYVGRTSDPSDDEATHDSTSSAPSPHHQRPKMPAFGKVNYISGLPVASATRRFSANSAFAGQPVHPRLEDLQKPPTRNEHIVATLAHSRGEIGTGCDRAARGRRCEFADTVVLMQLRNGVRVLGRCTNCHFACDGAQCGAVAVPASTYPAPPVCSARTWVRRR